MRKSLFAASMFFLAAKSFADVSLSPLGGYNPVYRFFVGSAVFYENHAKTQRYGLITVITFRDAYQFKPSVDLVLSRRWKLQLDSEYSLGFVPYFGEGIRTQPNQTRIFSHYWSDRVYGHYQFVDSQIVLSPFVQIQGRRETSIELDRSRRAFPDENSLAFGVKEKIDYGETKETREPVRRLSESVALSLVPRETFLSAYKNDTFLQLEATAGYLHTFSGEWAIANQTVFETSFLASPPYTYRYKLGGTDRLRGYYDNRFRGAHSVLNQTELRFPIYRVFSGVAFLDAGSVSETRKFGVFRFSRGLGLRIGLPPDYIEKVRIDVGFARDQRGVFVDFGETF